MQETLKMVPGPEQTNILKRTEDGEHSVGIALCTLTLHTKHCALYTVHSPHTLHTTHLAPYQQYIAPPPLHRAWCTVHRP